MSTVTLETSHGNISIELNEEKAPITVKNFLSYVNDGFFDGTIFHRVIPNFMIQGGGFMPGMVQKKCEDPISQDQGNSGIFGKPPIRPKGRMAILSDFGIK